MNESLDAAVSADTLIDLARAGHLSPTALARALRLIGVIPSAEKWQQFAQRLLLFLGAGLTIVGIFFFFAWNWADLPRLAKLGIVEALIVACVAVAAWLRLNLTGKVALMAASLLVGALLALFGQQYQYQADAWFLFAVWAGLITGWVIIGRFAPLWFGWQVLINIALILWWQQRVNSSVDVLLGLLCLLNVAAWLLWEWAQNTHPGWTHRMWARASAVAALCAVFVPTLTWAVDLFDPARLAKSPLLLVAVLAYAGLTAVVLWLYRRRRPDLPLVTATLLLLIVLGATVVYAVTIEIDALVAFFVTGASVVGMGVAAARFIQASTEEAE